MAERMVARPSRIGLIPVARDGVELVYCVRNRRTLSARLRKGCPAGLALAGSMRGDPSLHLVLTPLLGGALSQKGGVQGGIPLFRGSGGAPQIQFSVPFLPKEGGQGEVSYF